MFIYKKKRCVAYSGKHLQCPQTVYNVKGLYVVVCKNQYSNKFQELSDFSIILQLSQ